MQVHYQIFRTEDFDTWDDTLDEAAVFATSVGHPNLINISQSEDHDGPVVTVWYWADRPLQPNRAKE